MLKIVVFDSGFGGELFADYLEVEVPILEVIRVIDWRHSKEIIGNLRTARAAAEAALRPYLNRVDLIVFANFLLSTDLKYFRRKYRSQKFLGFSLTTSNLNRTRSLVVLTTKAFSHSLKYRYLTARANSKIKTIDCDTWPELIDDGELTYAAICDKLASLKTFSPHLVILACTQFSDLKLNLQKIFGPTIKIDDLFRPTLKKLCHELRLRGLDGRKCK